MAIDLLAADEARAERHMRERCAVAAAAAFAQRDEMSPAEIAAVIRAVPLSETLTAVNILAVVAATVLETRDRWLRHVEAGERTTDPLVWAEHVAAVEQMRTILIAMTDNSNANVEPSNEQK